MIRVKSCEQVAANTLEALGYELTQSKQNNTLLDITEYNLLNARLIKEWKEKASNDKQKRMDQQHLLELIKNRLKVPFGQTK